MPTKATTVGRQRRVQLAELSEVADEVRAISVQQHRWIKLACAFPVSPTYTNTRGINKTEWIRVDRASYDLCLDTRDYRPKGAP